MSRDKKLISGSFVARAARWAGVDRTLLYTVIARCWSVTAGPVSLLFIATFLTTEEQGYYFTFWSVLGLWVFFDLGLSFVVTQFASHERAALRLTNGCMEGDGVALSRLASLMRLALRWYGVSALLMIVCVLPAGIAFFSRYEEHGTSVNWMLPWTLVVITAAANLLVGPFVAILEGSGLMRDTALMRLLQGITANLLFWMAMLSNARLYSTVVLSGTMAIFSAVWIVTRHRAFFAGLMRTRDEAGRIRWRTEIWPFQWRFAISWMTSYFMFQIFNPLLFATRGAEVAGQMGSSLMVTTAIAIFAYSWINTKAVDYGSFVAVRDFERLDHVFRISLIQSTVVIVALSAAFFSVAEYLRWAGHPLSERLLPPLPLFLLIVATILNHLVGAQAAYLRAFKREPFLGIFACMAISTAITSLLLTRPFGASGMMAGLVASVGTIGIGFGTLVFTRVRQSLRDL